MGSTGATSIHVGACARLRQALGITGEPAKVPDVWQMLAWVERPVVEALGVDILTMETFKLSVYSDEELAWCRHWAEMLRRETDKALIGESGLIPGRWGSYQEWMYTVAADPGYVRAFYDRKIENLLTNIRLYADAVGDNIDIMGLGEDFGTQRGLMISPHTFRQLVAPYYKRLYTERTGGDTVNGEKYLGFDQRHSRPSQGILEPCAS